MSEFTALLKEGGCCHLKVSVAMGTEESLVLLVAHVNNLHKNVKVQYFTKEDCNPISVRCLMAVADLCTNTGIVWSF